MELIGATTSRSGLSVRAELDRGSYPKGIEISDDQLAAAGVKKHDFHVNGTMTCAHQDEQQSSNYVNVIP